MTALYCIALVMHMEASTQNDLTKSLVASVVIERAKQEKTDICKSIKKKNAYSWMWDGRNTVVKKQYLDRLLPIARKEVSKPSITGRYFFNEKRLGIRYKTKNKPIYSESMVFY